MRSRGARAVAIALAVAALVPGPARPDPLVDAEQGAGKLADLLASVEDSARRPDETMSERAARKFASGETQYLLGDWGHAALLMGEALDDPGFRAGPQGGTATFYLGDALRHAGSCGAARPYLSAYLQSGEADRRGEALTAALECAVRLGHAAEFQPLLAEADRYFQGQLSPELRYLSARVIRARTDLSPDDQYRQADAAFAAVGEPFTHQAVYYQAVMRVERNDLAGASERFAACAGMQAKDVRQREVQDLCRLGLARVRTEAGDLAGAVAAYVQVPIDSPYFDEALYEAAYVQGREGQLDPALHATETLLELAPDSPLASRSMLLQGQLFLQQGKYEAANQAYQGVIQEYGPVRDELDGILTQQEDPVRYFADLLSHGGKPSEVVSVIPAPALRAGLARPELARASELMQDLDAEARDVEQNRGRSERIAAVLSRGAGVDAFPRLREGYAGVQAVENGVAVLQGQAATAAVDAAEGALEPGARTELANVHAERVVLEARLDAMPRTAEAVRARLDRWQARIDGLDRDAFALGYAVDGARAAIAGIEAWLAGHRGELQGQREQRESFAAEVRKHREVVAAYEDELKKLRQEIALARDAAAGSDTLDDEARLRDQYLSLLARERTLLDGARGRLSAADEKRLERAWAAADRLGQLSGRARELSDWIASEARRRADGLRAQLAAEQAVQAQEAAALRTVQVEARGAIGQLAYRSFSEVRRDFYQLVLRADVGLNDVVWTRKKDRLDGIQKLSIQEANELKALDKRYRPALKEEE